MCCVDRLKSHPESGRSDYSSAKVRYRTKEDCRAISRSHLNKCIKPPGMRDIGSHIYQQCSTLYYVAGCEIQLTVQFNLGGIRLWQSLFLFHQQK